MTLSRPAPCNTRRQPAVPLRLRVDPLAAASRAFNCFVAAAAAAYCHRLLLLLLPLRPAAADRHQLPHAAGPFPWAACRAGHDGRHPAQPGSAAGSARAQQDGDSQRGDEEAAGADAGGQPRPLVLGRPDLACTPTHGKARIQPGVLLRPSHRPLPAAPAAEKTMRCASPQEDINAVSKSADTIKKRLAELDRGNEQVGGSHAALPCSVLAGSRPPQAAGGSRMPGWALLCRGAEQCPSSSAAAAAPAVSQAQGVRPRQQQRAHAHRHHGSPQEKAERPDGGVPRPAVGAVPPAGLGWASTNRCAWACRLRCCCAPQAAAAAACGCIILPPLLSSRPPGPAACPCCRPQVTRAGRVPGSGGAADVHGCGAAFCFP